MDKLACLIYLCMLADQLLETARDVLRNCVAVSQFVHQRALMSLFFNYKTSNSNMHWQQSVSL